MKSVWIGNHLLRALPESFKGELSLTAIVPGDRVLIKTPQHTLSLHMEEW